MAIPRFEVAFGAIDGFNTVYSVSTGYRPASTAVFLNGQLKRADFTDGWTETDPVAGVITLNEPPLEADVVQVFFTDSGTGVLPGEEVTPLRGTIKAAADLLGRLQPILELRGKTEGSSILNGRMLPTGSISAKVAEIHQLRGTLEIC